MKHLISLPDESIHGIEVIIDVHTSLGRSEGSDNGVDILLTWLVEGA